MLTSTSSLPPLLQHLMTPEPYPHPTQSPIQLLQTHLSYVLLTGPFAYKIKKPLQLPYLDFHTLARRMHFCGEELRLNRRFSPDIYRELVAFVPVGADAWRCVPLASAEPDAITEVAVQMTQLPPGALMSEMLASDSLTPEHMRAFAEALAAFHGVAAIDRDSPLGSLEALRQSIALEQQDSEKLVGHTQTATHLAATRELAARCLDRHADRIIRRKASGWVRECHADLHLGNVAWVDNCVRMFDCVEFNPAFSHVDVAYDVAFVLMDLAMHERPELAAAFRSAYLEATGDEEGMRLIPFYQSLQAGVRGNVESFTAAAPGVPEHVRVAALARATRYFTLELRFLTEASN